MHVLCCYTSLHPATAEALRRYAPGAELVDVSGAPGMYRRVLREHWDIPADLVIIEHDIEIGAEVLPSFAACAQPWCTYAYHVFPEPHRALTSTGIGCVKFTAAFRRLLPWDEVTAASCRVCGALHQDHHGIDNQIYAYADEEHGMKPHVHGEVVHHHVYEERPLEVLIYVESLRARGLIPSR